ncbi:MAG: lipid-binding SYLF domain-containing protein [Bryobacteraceae bacterium]
MQTQMGMAAEAETPKRLALAATVVQEIMASSSQSIPEDLLEDAHCAVIVPGLKKGAFIVSAKYGKGFITCRGPGNRAWSSPAAIRVEGGGIGFQIGGSETDLILLVMNDRGAKRLMSSQFTVGGEGEVAAGPVGRNASAQTDAKFTAEILSWSRSRGVFAGVALQGATLREDQDDNAELYGSKLSTEQVVHRTAAPPASARPLLAALTAHSPKEHK